MKVVVKSDGTIGDLIDQKREQILRVNHEYQRGLRWHSRQKQMFIDSILRGYSIPAFYFHRKETEAAGITNTFLDIVDGQQRIDAIAGYAEGAFPLLDSSDSADSRFPNFIRDYPCPWGGKRFAELPEHLQERLKEQRTVIYEITTTNENEIRDLFIRLQEGTPLSPQDKRDSWPGNFTEFVLRTGGKTEIDRWPGMPLFTEVYKGNESRRRQFVAQLFMLFWTRRRETDFCDIKSRNIDDFYHSQVGFDLDSMEAKRFKKVSENLYTALSDGPRVVGHHLIHLFLMADLLLDEYVVGTWESRLASSLHEFGERTRKAREADRDGTSSEHHRYLTEYGQLSQTQSDTASTIRRRHVFFIDEMLKLLSPTKLDSQRAFTALERETVFFRDQGRCQYCRMKETRHSVPWEDCEIHHVVPHAVGGKTNIENGILVHRDCHPKSAREVEQVAEWWKSPAKDQIILADLDL